MHQSAASAASLASAAAARDWVLRRGEQAEVKGILGEKTGAGPFEKPVSLARQGIEGANYVAGNMFTVTSEPFQNLLRAIWLTCLTFRFFLSAYIVDDGPHARCAHILPSCLFSSAAIHLFLPEHGGWHLWKLTADIQAGRATVDEKKNDITFN